MKHVAFVLLIVAALGMAFLAGCKGTKVHYEEDRTIQETRPVVTGDNRPTSSSMLRVDKDGKVHFEEETTTESTRPVIVGD